MKRFAAILMAVICLVFTVSCGSSRNSGEVGESSHTGNVSVTSEAVTEENVTGSETEAVSEQEEQTESTMTEALTEEKLTEAEPAAADPTLAEDDEDTGDPVSTLEESGTYTSKDDVALYIHTYGKLPENFITKKDAESLGWSGGSLEPYAAGKCIGGDRFGNYEGKLPKKKGRSYTECDIDTLGAKKRGAKRIVFSNDGLIYYTEDHYENFELLYGGEEQ